MWAAGAVHAVGRVNFLDDSDRDPHCKPKTIYSFFGIAESTGQNKSKAIRDALGMGPFAHQWMLPSGIGNTSTLWIISVNGFMIDIRTAPEELQRLAYEKGLIPYVPADRGESITDD